MAIDANATLILFFTLVHKTAKVVHGLLDGGPSMLERDSLRLVLVKFGST